MFQMHIYYALQTWSQLIVVQTNKYLFMSNDKIDQENTYIHDKLMDRITGMVNVVKHWSNTAYDLNENVDA